jgi:hypothetical protein
MTYQSVVYQLYFFRHNNDGNRDVIHATEGRTLLHGVVPGKAEFDIWADDTDRVHVMKTKTLTPPPDADNIITFRF